MIFPFTPCAVSPTAPNNRLCNLPYIIPTLEWESYFCERSSSADYTCPTVSGTGSCLTGQFIFLFLPSSTILIGKYGLVTVKNVLLDQMFSTTLFMEPNTVHCLDFQYYLTNTSANEKIEVGWQSYTGSGDLGSVTSVRTAKWEPRRFPFSSSSEREHQVRCRMNELC